MDKKIILVVEDETELLSLIVKKLEASGFATISTKTVLEALDILGKNKIDAVWLDHFLSGDKCGLDLVAEMKDGGKKFDQIPIFVVSNTAGAEERKSYVEFGVDKYYVKTNATLNKIIEDMEILLNK